MKNRYTMEHRIIKILQRRSDSLRRQQKDGDKSSEPRKKIDTSTSTTESPKSCANNKQHDKVSTSSDSNLKISDKNHLKLLAPRTECQILNVKIDKELQSKKLINNNNNKINNNNNNNSNKVNNNNNNSNKVNNNNNNNNSSNKNNNNTINHHTRNKLIQPKTISSNSERPLKCLETLAQKAGITFDEKYEVASTLLTLEKSQSPAQVAAPSAVPLQISQEQLQQLQQIQQLQQAQFAAIQVKQEFPNQNQLNSANAMTELKAQMVEHNQGQVQQMQIIENSPSSPHHTPNSTAMANPQAQHSTTTISTMSPLQLPGGQVPADWGHGRLQVLQPSISNQGYLQHLYSPVLMSGNLLHSGLGQQPIQVIASGKPFQGGQLTPQMLTATAQSKPMISGTTGSFSGAYTLPTIPSSQSQTLLFSPVSVISSQPQQQQQNILPTMAAPSNNKNSQQEMQKNLQGQKVLQKVSSTTSVQNSQNLGGGNPQNQQPQQCVQVSQAMPTAQIISPLQQTGSQPMQITAPWLQSVPQFWTNGIQPPTLLAPNPIIIRGTQPDGTQGMFIPQAATHQPIQSQQQNQTLTLPTATLQQTIAKPRSQIETLAPKQQIRAPPILPQNGPPLRPASSVSTQTAQNQNLMNQKQNKLRTKQQTVRPALPGIKTDASNQTKTGVPQIQQQQTMHQVVTSAGNKMVVMSTGTPINIQGGQITQQVQNQGDKQFQMQQMKQQQQNLIHQQQLLMQQTPTQQLIPHQIAQQIQLQQQQHQQQQQLQHQANMQQNAQQQQFITQQQQQQQIQNQLMQQQHQQQQQQQHQQQQQQQQQQQHQQHQQQQQQQHQQQQQQQHQQQQQQQQQQQHQQQIQQQQAQAHQQQLVQQHQQQRDVQGQQQQAGIVHQIVVQQQSVPQMQSVPISVSSNVPNLQGITLQSKQHACQTLDRSSMVSITPIHSQPIITQVHSSPIPQSPCSNSSVSNSQHTLTNSITSTTSLGMQSPQNPILAMTALTASTLSQPSNAVSTSSNTKSLEAKKISIASETTASVPNSSHDSKSSNTDSKNSNHSSQTSQPVVNGNVEDKDDTVMKSIESSTPDSSKNSSQPTDPQTSAKTADNKTQPDQNEDSKTELENSKSQSDENLVKTTVTSSNLQKNSNSSIKSEKDLPKAMIKPNVLTHVIEGFVIQEANEPFAVTRQRYSEKETLGEPPKKRIALEETTNKEVSSDMVTCEHCGKQELKSKLKKKRYCSVACARAPKSTSIEQNTEIVTNSTDEHAVNNKTNEITNNNNNNVQMTEEKNHQTQEVTSKAAHTSTQEEVPLMSEWTVSDVCEFIKNLPGCSDYADDFALQEIDGQALLLLKENHLVNAMGMKLGPALKIVARVESMKESSGLDKETQ